MRASSGMLARSRVDALAEDFGDGGVDRDDPVADRLEVPGDLVGVPFGLIGEADDGDRLRLRQDLPHRVIVRFHLLRRLRRVTRG